MDSAEELVTEWLSLDEVGARLGIPTSKVRRMLEDRVLCALKRGHPKALMVPAAFIADGEAVPALKGTVISLEDAGFDVEEIISWLFTRDDSLPGRPIDLLRSNNKAEVRRRAQALAL